FNHRGAEGAGESFNQKNTKVHKEGLSPQRAQGSTADRLFEVFAFECGQRFLVHVPGLEDLENGFRHEACANQLAENACGLLLILWFLEALAAEVVAG